MSHKGLRLGYLLRRYVCLKHLSLHKHLLVSCSHLGVLAVPGLGGYDGDPLACLLALM
jgi:hypothetical protein